LYIAIYNRYKNILSNYLILHMFGAFVVKKMTFSTRKSGIPPGISGILFFKFEFTFRSENAVFGGISSGIPFPVIGGIRKKNEKVNPGVVVA